MSRRYRIERVDAELKSERRSRWKIREEPLVRGVEHVYDVTDGNYARRNAWEFLVRVPDARGGSIEVRPSVVPDVRAWAGLDRRALMFERVTIGRYRGACYCKVAIADPSGERTRLIARIDEKDKLPYWFRSMRPRMRAKEAIRHTRGTDSNSLVITVPADDHQQMIALFLAAKAWVLKERFRFRHGAA
ncbi:MAG: hypothetical protein ACRD1W_18445 [Vicinamibacterales bacterium]